MSNATVSIVVPSRGGRERLPLLLDSLTAQTCADFEVVVVIDGDVDDSETVLRERTDLPIHAIVLPQNLGRAGALNAGFAAARGDVLVRCDDDLELPSAYVESQIRLHGEADRGVIGMCTNVYPEETAYATTYGRDGDVALRTSATDAPPDLRWRFWGGNVSVRRADFERVGDYDTGYHRYGWEDIDWGYRLHRSGRELVISPDVAALHHVAATTTATRASRAFESGWSQVHFERKHGLVLQADATLSRSPWDRLVVRTSRGLDLARVARRGAAIDRTLPWTPRPLARKRVALLVEAAALAGYHEADTNVDADNEGIVR